MVEAPLYEEIKYSVVHKGSRNSSDSALEPAERHEKSSQREHLLRDWR